MEGRRTTVYGKPGSKTKETRLVHLETTKTKLLCRPHPVYTLSEKTDRLFRTEEKSNHPVTDPGAKRVTRPPFFPTRQGCHLIPTMIRITTEEILVGNYVTVLLTPTFKFNTKTL